MSEYHNNSEASRKQAERNKQEAARKEQKMTKCYLTNQYVPISISAEQSKLLRSLKDRAVKE